MKCSVIMASYNGEKYIWDQLQSIVGQTRVPDEIVICDDSSTDCTVSIIQKFISMYPSINIKLFVNEKNLGYAGNFFKAASMSEGEILFFSDQDDLWDKEKIKNMMPYFERNIADGVICDFCLIDAEAKVIGRKKKKKDNSCHRVTFEEMIKHFNCGGLNFAVKRAYVDEYSQYILDRGLSHDVPLGIILSAKGKLFKIGQVLVYHRVHNCNATKPEYSVVRRLGNVEKQKKSTKSKLKWLTECQEAVESNIDSDMLDKYKNTIKYYRDTENALNGKNLFALMRLCVKRNVIIDRKVAIFNFLTIIAQWVKKA